MRNRPGMARRAGASIAAGVSGLLLSMLLGGAVLGQDGVPAVWWRHVVRNLFKGLVMLSPLIAVPTVLSPRGVGVPETITRTVVVRG